MKAEKLSGKVLIAMPGQSDSPLGMSVVLVCSHSSRGTMGLVINKPAGGLSAKDLLDQLEIPSSSETERIRVHFGGPMENSRGFVLHSHDYKTHESTLNVDSRFGMTGTMQILQDISRGNGPESCLLALGYAGWGAGQLEREIQKNGWLVGDASHDLVFGMESSKKWMAAVGSIGVDPALLSQVGGTA